MEDSKLAILDPILFTHFQALSQTAASGVSGDGNGGTTRSGEDKSPHLKYADNTPDSRDTSMFLGISVLRSFILLTYLFKLFVNYLYW
jgi:hypothetical protein